MKLTYLSLLFVLLIASSCNKPKAVASSMTAEENQALVTSFTRLDAAIAKHLPTVSANLAPGVRESDILKLRSALNEKQIDTLEAWYRWHNGAAKQPCQLLPLGYPVSFEEALNERKLLQSIPFIDALPKGAIKLMDDGAGDGYYLDITSNNPTVFYHMLEDSTSSKYGTLEEFINFITLAFESGAFSINSSGNFDFDIEIYDSLEQKHLKKHGNL